MTNTILAGHGRVEAAKLLGLATVPCLRIEHMTDAQKRAYILADNKIALNAGWDETILAEELRDLMVLDPGFDLGLTGFSIPEVDGLIEGLEVVEPGDPREDKLPDPALCPSRCREGDVWQLGLHRLVCGNSLDPNDTYCLVCGPAVEPRLGKRDFQEPAVSFSPKRSA